MARIVGTYSFGSEREAVLSFHSIIGAESDDWEDQCQTWIALPPPAELTGGSTGHLMGYRTPSCDYLDGPTTMYVRGEATVTSPAPNATRRR